MRSFKAVIHAAMVDNGTRKQRCSVCSKDIDMLAYTENGWIAWESQFHIPCGHPSFSNKQAPLTQAEIALAILQVAP